MTSDGRRSSAFEDTTELRRLNHAIGERAKEINAFYVLSRRLLRAGKDSLQELLQDIANLLPPAFQFPEITEARGRVGTLEAGTGGFIAGHPTLRAGDAGRGFAVVAEEVRLQRALACTAIRSPTGATPV